MKVLMVAALTAIVGIAHSSTADAAGWRSCKASSAKCTVSQTKTVKVQNQRRASFRYRDVNSMPARDWFYRRMLDN
jgi:hypothetical protein